MSKMGKPLFKFVKKRVLEHNAAKTGFFQKKLAAYFFIIF